MPPTAKGKTRKRGAANGSGRARAASERSPTLAKLLDRSTRRYQIAMAVYGAVRRTKAGARLPPWTQLPDNDRGRAVAAVKMPGGAGKARAKAAPAANGSGAGDTT